MKKFIISVQIILVYASLTLSQTANITTHDYKEVSNSKRYSITMQYPQVDFGPDALMGLRGIAQDINHCIDTLTQNQKNDFRELLKSLPPEPCAQEFSGLHITYNTQFNNSALFSFLFEVFSGPDCANHPYTYKVSLNYSTANIGAFGISDIFDKNSNYLQFLSEYCFKELKIKAAANDFPDIDYLIKDGTTPDANNFRIFNFDDKGVTITFNPYSVGPWNWGIQSVSIPYMELKSYIDPNGPLGEMTK